MQNVLEVARTTRNFAFDTRGVLKLRRFSSPHLVSLKCHAVYVPPRNGLRPLGGWGKGTDNISDYDLALSPPQFHFSKDTIKQFIIGFFNS